MNRRNWNRSLLVASLIAAALAGVSVWLEWSNPERSTLRLSLLALILILSAAALSYALRIVRFYLILARSGVRVSLPSTALAQAVGFALSVTPGSIGEVFKLHLIEEWSGTSLLKAAPALLLDRGMEAAGFVGLVFLSAIAFPSIQSKIPGIPLYTIGVALLIGSILVWSRAGILMARGREFLSRFSATRRVLIPLQDMLKGMESRVTRREVIAGLALTGLARIADGLVLLLVAQMLGVSIALPAAIFVIALSGFAGGISLLPGGAGAAESTMAGLLMFSGAPFAAALGITLLARMSTLWLWVGLGLGLALIIQIQASRLAKQPLSIR